MRPFYQSNFVIIVHELGQNFSNFVIGGHIQTIFLQFSEARHDFKPTVYELCFKSKRKNMLEHVCPPVFFKPRDSCVLKNSPFSTEKRSTTIILPHLTNGKRKQTQSFSPKKYIYNIVKVKCCLTGRVCVSEKKIIVASSDIRTGLV